MNLIRILELVLAVLMVVISLIFIMTIVPVDDCIWLCTNDGNVPGTDDGDGVGINNGYKVGTHNFNGTGIGDW